MSEMILTRIFAAAAATLVLAPATAAIAQLKAFPGAEGAGANSVGGRGGDVYVVTNLNDSGAGSLRNGISTASGARTIVFNVGGTIRLLSDLNINKPNITIAGQTAPGGGITLVDRMTRINNTSNVVLRHMHLRVGDTYTRQVDSDYEPDALWVSGSNNVIVDHVSAGWSVDETLSVTHGSTNVTVQWSTITESLRNAGHSKGAHGYGSLINGGAITYHHNLYAHHDSRNPRPGSWEGGTLDFDFRNNVVYDWGGQAGYNGDEPGVVNMNYVGNYLVAGPSTSSSKLTNAFAVGTTPTFIYQSGNKIDGTRDGSLNGTRGTDGGWSMFSNETATNKLTSPHALALVTTQTADDTYASVLAQAGAMPWNRDATDARVIADVRNGTGSLVDTQNAADWNALITALAVFRPAGWDTDGDGMPNAWETTNGFNPSLADNNLVQGDGYTALEHYLNSLTAVPEPTAIVPLALILSGAMLRRSRLSSFCL
jgi:pectate lyase